MQRKKLIIIISIAVVIFVAAAIVIPIAVINSNKCDHTYDNACDAICDECGETREVGAHDYAEATCTTPKTCTICGVTEGEMLAHSWKDATCTTPKTCSKCLATEGEALGHSPEVDDGDCTTAIKCSICDEITTAGKTEHIASPVYGDCTTPVKCTACNTVVIPAKTHDFTGEWLSDGVEHWHICENEGCHATDTKQPHDKGADGKCTVCGYVMEEVIDPHVCDYSVPNKDGTYHWMECSCGKIDETTKEEHKPIDDHNCSTEDKCSCGLVLTAATGHTPAADDGNCTTPVKCENCDQDAVAGRTEHIDSDHDGICDNEECQITVGKTPEDTSDGIDLPDDIN